MVFGQRKFLCFANDLPKRCWQIPCNNEKTKQLLLITKTTLCMKKSTLLSLASISTVFILFCGSIIIGCSGDDSDFDTAEFRTLADEKMTRAGESSSTPYVPVTKDSTVICKSVDTTIVQSMGVYADAVIHITSQQGYNWEINPQAEITFIEYGYCKDVEKTNKTVNYNGSSINVIYSAEIKAEDPLTRKTIYVNYSGGVSAPVSKIIIAGK